MPNPMPFVTNNPSAFGLTPIQQAGNNRLGVNNVTSMPNVVNPKSLGQPSANGYSQLPNNPKYTPFTDYKSANPVVNQSQAVQTTAKTVATVGNLSKAAKGLGIAGSLLALPSVASDVGDAFGYLWNLPKTVSNELEKDRLKKVLQQQEAKAADTARVNNYPPSSPAPYTGGQSNQVLYRVGIQYVKPDGSLSGISYDNAYGSLGALFVDNGVGKLRSSSGASAMLAVADMSAVKDSSISNVFVRSVTRVDGQPDTGGNPPSLIPSQEPSSPPPYPSRDNWEYGDVNVNVTGDAKKLSDELWKNAKPESTPVTPFSQKGDADKLGVDTSLNPKLSPVSNNNPSADSFPSVSSGANPLPVLPDFPKVTPNPVTPTPDTRPLNTTPNTQPENDTGKILLGLAGLGALLALLLYSQYQLHLHRFLWVNQS